MSTTETRTLQKRSAMPPALQGIRAAGNYTFDELYRFAQMCHASGLFEDITDAAQAMVKIVKGQELGLPPTTAMAAFDIIRKRLFIKPWAIAAKINTCGYGYFTVEEQTDARCALLFHRKHPGVGWIASPPVVYTIEEARAHGLIDRSPHWKASPAHMLYQRALGRGAGMYFPELLAGLTPAQEDTALPPERLAENVTLLFDDRPTASTPPRQTPGSDEPPEPDPAATLLEHITRVVLASGRTPGVYWRETVRRFQVVSPAALTLPQLQALLGEAEAYLETQGTAGTQEAPSTAPEIPAEGAPCEAGDEEGQLTL